MTFLPRHQWIKQVRDCADAFEDGAKVPRVGFSPRFRAELVAALRDLADLIEARADQTALDAQVACVMEMVFVCLFPEADELPEDAARELVGVAGLEAVAGHIHMLHQCTRGKEGLQ